MKDVPGMPASRAALYLNTCNYLNENQFTDGNCHDYLFIIPITCYPMLPLAIAGYAMTSALEKGKKLTESKCHKVTLMYNIFVFVCLVMTIYFFYFAGKLFDTTGKALFSGYGIAAAAIVFNIFVFAKKTWKLYVFVILGHVSP